MNVHLIDGTFEIYRHHFSPGHRSHLAPDGTQVGAVLGLVRSLTRLLQQDDVTHVAFSFDTVIESFRNDLFAGYKTGDGIEPELKAQFSIAQDAAEALGIVTWRNMRYEADDAIATMAVRAAAHPGVEQVVMRSPDKDLAQVISGQRVVMYDPIRRKTTDEPAVLDKFGVPPASIPDYLGLVGDTADGIPGVAKWGAKSTATVLRAYGHVKHIPTDCESWSVKVRGAKGLSDNLEAMRDEALLYVDLATLRTDVPLVTHAVEDLQWRGVDRAKLTALEDRLGTAIASGL